MRDKGRGHPPDEKRERMDRNRDPRDRRGDHSDRRGDHDMRGRDHPREHDRERDRDRPPRDRDQEKEHRNRDRRSEGDQEPLDRERQDFPPQRVSCKMFSRKQVKNVGNSMLTDSLNLKQNRFSIVYVEISVLQDIAHGL